MLELLFRPKPVLFSRVTLGLWLTCASCASSEGDQADAGSAVDNRDASSDAPDAESGASFVLGLALNDATDLHAPRGWPLVLMGVAALSEDVAQAIPLDETSLSLAVLDSNGETQTWPVARLTAVVPDLALGGSREEIEVVWGLASEQTRALQLGRYTARLSWAGQQSPPLAFELVDRTTPVDPTAAALEQARLASLEARLALLQNDPARALVHLNAALSDQPEHVGLLVWKARAHDAADEQAMALASSQAALDAFRVQNPNQKEPPFTVYEVRRRVMDRLIGVGP